MRWTLESEVLGGWDRKSGSDSHIASPADSRNRWKIGHSFENTVTTKTFGSKRCTRASGSFRMTGANIRNMRLCDVGRHAALALDMVGSAIAREESESTAAL